MKLPKFWSNRLALIAISLIVSLSAFAQVTVNGLVLDSGHEPIIGASVFVKGTQTGTATDIDGRFSIKVPSPTSTLVISYLGCLPAEVKANDPALATGIVLRENSEVLEEVLVIGYGSVKKSDATGSVTAIKPDESNMGSKVTVQDASWEKSPVSMSCPLRVPPVPAPPSASVQEPPFLPRMILCS